MAHETSTTAPSRECVVVLLLPAACGSLRRGSCVNWEAPTTMDTNQADQDEMPALEATHERPGCQHHWVIDPPEGPVSKGACRSCREERDFPNYTEGRFNIRRSDAS